MMKSKLWITISLAVLLVAGLFAGCSTAANTENGAYAPKEDVLYDGLYDGADMAISESATAAPGQSVSTGSAGVQNQKLIRTMDVDAETDDLDALLSTLDARISELGGYVENKSIRNGSYSERRSYRTADLTIRIPVAKLDAFVEHVKGATNIVNYRENADDITLSYVATASRITALETEQQRLLELLAKAEDMTDLLLIEQRLTDVRTELEEVTSQLRLYDNLVDYGTVDLSVTQVQEYTVVEEKTLWQRMGAGLKDNWDRLCQFGEELLVLLVTSVPYLIPLGLAGLVTWLVVKLATRKSGKKRSDPPADPSAS